MYEERLTQRTISRRVCTLTETHLNPHNYWTFETKIPFGLRFLLRSSKEFQLT